MKTNDEKWLAAQLEKHADGWEAELPDGLAHVSSSLQQTMREMQPRPGFVNELAGQLHERRAANDQRRSNRPAWLWRLLAGTAGAAAVAIFVLFAAGLFSEPVLEPSVTESETALPPIVLQSEEGPFAGIEFRLYEPLSSEREALALYRVERESLPETTETVSALAMRLGLENPTIYTTGQGWLAEDGSGRRLTIDPSSSLFSVIYSAPDRHADGGQALSEADASTRATDFLERSGFLPPAYETHTQRDGTGGGRVLVKIVPLLEGRPVHYAAAEVVIDPIAGVIGARFLPLRFTSTSEVVTARSAQDAFAESLQRGAPMDVFQLDSSGSALDTYYPSLAEAEVGDDVRLLGFVQRLQPVDGGPGQIRLSQTSGESVYFLRGSRAEELQDGQLAEVSGVLAQSMDDGNWAVTVGNWQAPPIDNHYMDCQTGFLHREAGELGFLSDDGRTPYKLANPPAVAGGQRAEVCAIFRYTPQPLPWLSMTVPPRDERIHAVGSMSGSATGGEVQVVEVTRVVIHEDEDHAPTPPGARGIVTEQIMEAGGTVIAQAQPVEQATLEVASPFVIGQKVEVTGVVGGFLYVEDEQVVPHVTLAIDTDDDPATAPLAYPLQGPWGLLLEISRQNHLHVTVLTTVVEAEGEFKGPSGLALQIDGNWWRTWPDEAVETFRGHYEVATLEGREVRLLVDEATGKRYVDAQTLYYARPGDSLMSSQPHADDSMWVTSVVNPDPNTTFGGLPILTVLKQQGGPNLPDNPGEWMLDVTMPLRTSKPTLAPVRVSNTLVIEQAVLGYTYSGSYADERGSQTLQPVWLFYGHSSDDMIHFVLRAPAVGEHLE